LKILLILESLSPDREFILAISLKTSETNIFSINHPDWSGRYGSTLLRFKKKNKKKHNAVRIMLCDCWELGQLKGIVSRDGVLTEAILV
jgi:hypothetical protein